LSHALTVLQDAGDTSKALTDELGKAIQSGDIEAQRQLVGMIFDSPAVRLCTSISANMKIKPAKRQSLERCFDVASDLSFSAPLPEIVPVFPKQKSFGKVRMIHDPRLLVRTAQQLVLQVMGKFLKPRPFQYTQCGVPAAIAQVKKLMPAGYVHAAHLDIQNCYLSFTPEKLVLELPLREDVVEHAVIGRHLKVRMSTETRYGKPSLKLPTSNFLHLARQGIPQGACCSPIIGMYIMACLPWHIHDGIVLVNFADDFLLLAMSAQQLEQAIGELHTAVTGLPGGHFKLKEISSGPIAKGLEFLGHHLRLTGGKLVTRPSTSNLESIAEELARLDDKLGKHHFPINEKPAPDGLLLLADMISKLTGWASAFRECDNMDRYLASYMVSIDQWIELLHVDMEQVKAAIDPSMAYVPSDYAFGHN
ncbi:MAG: hypothetical protein JJE34_04140, partial [Alphaproteobacteria bacterium]|nr:hypothetical protein [Alphaproteobacteria bacterium]